MERSDRFVIYVWNIAGDVKPFRGRGIADLFNSVISFFPIFAAVFIHKHGQQDIFMMDAKTVLNPLVAGLSLGLEFYPFSIISFGVWFLMANNKC